MPDSKRQSLPGSAAEAFLLAGKAVEPACPERGKEAREGELPVIALLAINSQHAHSSLAPWCLAAGLRAYARARHTAVVLEATVNEAPEVLVERVLACHPSVLGVSCQIWNIKMARLLAVSVKRALPGCVIVFGGPEVSYDAEELLRAGEGVDFLVRGEGEVPFAALVDALLWRLPTAGLPGVQGRGDDPDAAGVYCHSGMQPSPYSMEYFCRLAGRIAYLETSRGCPFRCAFCLSGRREHSVRQAPLHRVREELLSLAHSGARTVKLVDRTFNADPERAKEIFRFIIGCAGKEIPPGTVYHFEVAGDLLDEETLDILSTAPPGLFSLEIGVQSFNERTLEAVRRKTDLDRLSNAVLRLVEAGKLRILLDVIAGLPHEDLPQFRQSFDRAFALKPHALYLNRLKVIRGSAIREEPELFPCRYDPEPPYAVLETPWMSPEDFFKLDALALGLERGWNRRRFRRTICFLCEDCGLSPVRLLSGLGRRIADAETDWKGPGTLPLDEMTAVALAYFVSLAPEKMALIHDLMLADRLASTRSAVIPACLKRRLPEYRQAKALLDCARPRPRAAMRAAAMLYTGSSPRLIWSDFQQRNPVTGLYGVHVSTVAELEGSRHERPCTGALP